MGYNWRMIATELLCPKEKTAEDFRKERSDKRIRELSAPILKELSLNFAEKLADLNWLRGVQGHKKPGAIPQLCISTTAIFRATKPKRIYNLSNAPLRRKILIALINQEGAPIGSKELAEKCGTSVKSVQNTIFKMNQDLKKKEALHLSELLILGRIKSGYVLNPEFKLTPGIW